MLFILIAIAALIGAAAISFDVWLGNYRLKAAAARAGAVKEDSQLIGARFEVPRPEKDGVKVNLYIPEHREEEKLPVIFNIHGGGFVGNDADALDTQSERYSDAWKSIIVSVNFTKPDIKPIYYGVDEIVDTVLYFARNAKVFDADTERFSVIGYSSGGFYAAQAAIQLDAQGFRLASQVLAAPWVRGLPKNRGRSQCRRRRSPSAVTGERGPLCPFRGSGADHRHRAWCQHGRRCRPGAADSSRTRRAQEGDRRRCAGEGLLPLLEWPALLARLSERFAQPEASIAPVVQAYRDAYATAGPVDVYSRMLSDCSFGRDMVHLADFKANHRARVYFYRMEYVPPTIRYLRAFHTVELPLVGRMVVDPHAEALSRQLAGAWAAFARSGNPNHAGLPHWPPRPTGGADVMLFSEASRFALDPQAAARAALNGLVGDAGRRNLLHPMIPPTVR